MVSILRVLASALFAAGLAGGPWVEPAGAAAQSAGDVQRGQKVYAQHCASCHGPEGKGDGPAGAALTIKPQDLTDGRVLNPLPDHFLARVIREGGQSVGLSPLMQGFKGQISEAQIQDVIAYTRSLAQPAFKPADVLPVPERPEGPVQPIYFSHVIHAGSYKIDCQYCHAGARRTSGAGLPSVERCMGCHKVIGIQGNPEIDKLRGYWERQEPIPWVRIYKVPEHARFPHKNHVQAGVPCQTCHGRVEALERLNAITGQNLVNDAKNLVGFPADPPKLTMGWCVECHRAANDNNLASLSWLPRPAPKITRDKPKAPLDCVECHH